MHTCRGHGHGHGHGHAGARSEGELIRLRLHLLSTAWRLTPDAKALCALTLYRELQADGTLPPMRSTTDVSPQAEQLQDDMQAQQSLQEDASRLARRLSMDSHSSGSSSGAICVRAGYECRHTHTYLDILSHTLVLHAAK